MARIALLMLLLQQCTADYYYPQMIHLSLTG
jgi:hypothetical protein